MLLVIFITTSCKKDKTEPSIETYRVTMGNQAFGAYVNGQPWVADYRDAGNNYGPLDISMFDDYLPGFLPHYYWVWAKALKVNEKISLYIPPPLKPGRVFLNKTTYPYPAELNPPAYGMYEVYDPSKRYMTDANVTGYIDIIRADTITGSIEATFEFEAVNTATNEKVKITNGYFKKK